MRTAGALALAVVGALSAACAGVERSPARVGSDATGMVALSGGTFRAGERTGPTKVTVAYHRVRPFLLDATEVTVGAYAECVKAGACRPAAATVRWDAPHGRDPAAWSAYCNRDRADRADHPVNCVDWHEARAFCAWAGKRLPTEEEWEWAARGLRAGTAYPWGNEPPRGRACWSGERAAGTGGRGGTCPAGAHPEGDGPSGLKDLAGSVWEWTSTRDVIYPDSRGRGGSSVRVARGGGWFDADPGSLTAAVRRLEFPEERSVDLGFRCARSP